MWKQATKVRVWGHDASFHSSIIIRQRFATHNRMLMEFLSPCSSFLNPIKELFSAGRWKVWRLTCNSYSTACAVFFKEIVLRSYCDFSCCVFSFVFCFLYQGDISLSCCWSLTMTIYNSLLKPLPEFISNIPPEYTTLFTTRLINLDLLSQLSETRSWNVHWCRYLIMRNGLWILKKMLDFVGNPCCLLFVWIVLRNALTVLQMWKNIQEVKQTVS